MVEEVVGHLREERVGVDIEPDLACRPTGSTGTHARASRSIHSMPHHGYCPARSTRPSPHADMRHGRDGGSRASRPPCSWPPCSVRSLLLAACSGATRSSLPRPSRTFCEAAYRYERADPEKPRPRSTSRSRCVEKIATNAPKDIAADAEAFLDAMRRVQTRPVGQGQPEGAGRGRQREPAHQRNGCGFFEQDRSTGI